MKIYLCRHGECADPQIDPNRALIESSKQKLKLMARWLVQKNILVSNIFHSEKLRAKQTAEILASSLLPNNEILELPGLNPLDDVKYIANLINSHGFSTGTMFVGHLPFIAKLVSYLLIKNEHWPIIGFQPGTIVCLEMGEDNFWRIEWKLNLSFFD